MSQNGGIDTLEDLAQALRQLRRREARQRGQAELTYREFALKTGWSIGIIGAYFTGKAIPPTDRFDILIMLLGATPAERGMLATARDRVAERRRAGAPAAGPGTPPPPPPEVVTPARATRPLPARVARPGAPNQLPANVYGFTGRARELAELDLLLPEHEHGRRIALVCGTAGVGKTALVALWAQRVAHRFPDGQLYVNLRGFEPASGPMAPEEAIRGFLRAMDVPPHRIPTDLDELAARYRSELAHRRMLIVADNAREAAQVRPLLPGAPSTVVVVTSRDRLTGLVVSNGAHPIELDLMSTDESRTLLIRRLGTDRAAAEPGAVDEIIHRCARLPLALAVAAARARTDPQLTLGSLAEELADVGRRLDALEIGDALTDVRTVLSSSYAALSLPAARLFRLLGLHAGPDISAAAATSLAGCRPPEARRLLAELTAVNLLTEHPPHRYTQHDLLRTYAVEHSERLDPAERRAAATRLLDHYVHTAHGASRLLHEHNDPIPVPLAAPSAGAAPEPLAGAADATAWLTAEHQVLLATARHAAGTGFGRHAWQLTWAIDRALDLSGHWHDLASAWTVALAAARRMNDCSAEAYAHRLLAVTTTQLGRFDEAQAGHLHALELYRRTGDRLGAGHTHRSLANQHWRQGNLAEAVRHGELAFDLYRVVGYPRGQAFALNDVGWYHVLLGNHAVALSRCQQALALFGRLGDRVGQAHAWDSLAYANHHLGNHTTAIECYQHALTVFRDLRDRYEEASTLSRVGDAYQAAGEADGARRAWANALEILVELGHSDAGTVRTKLHNADGGR